MAEEVAATEAAIDDTTGFFYKLCCSACFQDAGSPLALPGNSRTVVSVKKLGLVLCSDYQGVHVVAPGEMVEQLGPKGQGRLPSNLLRATLEVPYVSIIDISSDDSVFALVSSASETGVADTISYYSLRQVVEQQLSEPLAVHTLPEGVRVLRFSKSPLHPNHVLVVSRTGSLYLGTVGNALEYLRVDGPVEAADWSPGGELVALSRGQRLDFMKWESRTIAGSVVIADLEEDESQSAVIDTVAWLQTNTMFVGVTCFEGSEEMDSFSGTVRWEKGWDFTSAASNSLQVQKVGVFPLEVDATGPGEGPYLLSAYVEAYGTVVYSHRKANDTHLRVTEMDQALGSTEVEVVEDALQLRVPLAQGDEDNYVVGLTMDYSVMKPVPHPTDDQAPDIPPSPTLVLLTIDGYLRLYRFGNLQKRECLCQEAQQTWGPEPEWVMQLPMKSVDSTEGREDSQTSVCSPYRPVDELGGRAPSLPVVPEQAAAVALPETDEDELKSDDDDDDDEEEEEEEESSVGTEEEDGLAPKRRLVRPKLVTSGPFVPAASSSAKPSDMFIPAASAPVKPLFNSLFPTGPPETTTHAVSSAPLPANGSLLASPPTPLFPSTPATPLFSGTLSGASSSPAPSSVFGAYTNTSFSNPLYMPSPSPGPQKAKSSTMLETSTKVETSQAPLDSASSTGTPSLAFPSLTNFTFSGQPMAQGPTESKQSADSLTGQPGKTSASTLLAQTPPPGTFSTTSQFPILQSGSAADTHTPLFGAKGVAQTHALPLVGPTLPHSASFPGAGPPTSPNLQSFFGASTSTSPFGAPQVAGTALPWGAQLSVPQPSSQVADATLPAGVFSTAVNGDAELTAQNAAASAAPPVETASQELPAAMDVPREGKPPKIGKIIKIQDLQEDGTPTPPLVKLVEGKAQAEMPASKLSGEVQEVAEMEASFLKVLHDVRRKAAEMDSIMEQLGAVTCDCGFVEAKEVIEKTSSMTEKVEELAVKHGEQEQLFDKIREELDESDQKRFGYNAMREVQELKLLTPKFGGQDSSQEMQFNYKAKSGVQELKLFAPKDEEQDEDMEVLRKLAQHLSLPPAMVQLVKTISRQFDELSEIQTALEAQVERWEEQLGDDGKAESEPQPTASTSGATPLSVRRGPWRSSPLAPGSRAPPVQVSSSLKGMQMGRTSPYGTPSLSKNSPLTPRLGSGAKVAHTSRGRSSRDIIQAVKEQAQIEANLRRSIDTLQWRMEELGVSQGPKSSSRLLALVDDEDLNRPSARTRGLSGSKGQTRRSSWLTPGSSFKGTPGPQDSPSTSSLYAPSPLETPFYGSPSPSQFYGPPPSSPYHQFSSKWRSASKIWAKSVMEGGHVRRTMARSLDEEEKEAEVQAPPRPRSPLQIPPVPSQTTPPGLLISSAAPVPGVTTQAGAPPSIGFAFPTSFSPASSAPAAPRPAQAPRPFASTLPGAAPSGSQKRAGPSPATGEGQRGPTPVAIFPAASAAAPVQPPAAPAPAQAPAARTIVAPKSPPSKKAAPSASSQPPIPSLEAMQQATKLGTTFTNPSTPPGATMEARPATGVKTSRPASPPPASGTEQARKMAGKAAAARAHAAANGTPAQKSTASASSFPPIPSADAMKKAQQLNTSFAQMNKSEASQKAPDQAKKSTVSFPAASIPPSPLSNLSFTPPASGPFAMFSSSGAGLQTPESPTESETSTGRRPEFKPPGGAAPLTAGTAAVGEVTSLFASTGVKPATAPGATSTSTSTSLFSFSGPGLTPPATSAPAAFAQLAAGTGSSLFGLSLSAPTTTTLPATSTPSTSTPTAAPLGFGASSSPVSTTPLFGGLTLGSTSSSSSVFGTTTAATSLFGSAGTSMSSSAAAPSSLFGTSGGSTAFSMAPTSTPAGSSPLFGGAPIPSSSAASSPAIFGNAATASSTPGSSFSLFGAQPSSSAVPAAASTSPPAPAFGTLGALGSALPAFGASTMSSPMGFAAPAALGGGPTPPVSSTAASSTPFSTPDVNKAFGAMSGFGASPPASGAFGFSSSPASSSPAGGGFGAPSTPPLTGAFGAPTSFGSVAPSPPASAGTATAFGGSGGAKNPFGGFAQASPLSQGGGAFGQPSGFGAPSALGAGFGAPSPLGSGFGQPAAPFGQPSGVFGASTSAPQTPFGSATGAPNAFASFGGAAQGGGGFAAFASAGGGGFGSLAGATGSGFGTPSVSTSNASMWQPRK